MIKVHGNLLEENLRKLFNFEKEGLEETLSPLFWHLEGGYKEEGDIVFIGSQVEKMKGNGYKLLLGTHKREFFHNENNQLLG